MNDATDNIYEPPKSDLHTESEGWDEFPRFSTWWVFLLSIVTLYFYIMYWMYTRSHKFNGIYPEKPISGFFMIGVPVLWIGSFLLAVIDPFVNGVLMTVVWGDFVDLIAGIITIFWAFSIRERMNRLLFDTGQEMSVEPIMTFIFGALYLNFKINQAKDVVAG